MTMLRELGIAEGATSGNLELNGSPTGAYLEIPTSVRSDGFLSCSRCQWYEPKIIVDAYQTTVVFHK